MTFPRKTDVARHLARKPKRTLHLRLGTGRAFTSTGSPAESAVARPSLVIDDLSVAVRSAQNDDKLVCK